MEMDFQEDQELEGLVDKEDPQDQLEQQAHQEFQELGDQKAFRVLMVFQVELVPMANQDLKDDLAYEGFVDLQVLLGHLVHQDVCAII